MSEEKFKQSRRPVNPILDPKAIMEQVEEIEKFVPGTDPMSQHAGNNPDLPNDLPFKMEGNVPPEFAALFKKGGQQSAVRQAQEEQQATTQRGPRLAYTDNPKLNELLEGIKEMTATYEEVRLPSLSKFYKDGEAPENGIIHVRQMTGEEEEILGTPRFLKKGQAIDMVFNNCVREQIKPEKWLTVDRNLLLFYLRGISIGTLYEVELKCPVCAARFESQIDLDSLMVNFCPKNFGPEHLRGVLPVTKYKFSYHLPTVHDENLINSHRDKRLKETGGEGVDDTFTWRCALLLEEIEGLNEHAALMTLISRLPLADVTHLRETLNDTPFGVDTKIGQTCPSCISDFEMELPIGASFFFPQRKKASRTPVSK